MVAKKDVHMPKHPELADKNVPNLHVMKAMQVAGRVQLAWVPMEGFSAAAQGQCQGGQDSPRCLLP